MRLDKVILKAALSTLAAILALLAAMILLLSFAFPQTMTGITYSMGMDSLSVHFATDAYNRTNKVEYIAHATEVSIGLNDYPKIDELGERLIADDEFAAYCAERNEALPEAAQGKTTYEEYLYRAVCVAKYKSGEKSGAVERAQELLLGAFKRNNPVVAVLRAAIVAEDKDTVEMIESELLGLDDSSLSAEDKQYLSDVLATVEEWNTTDTDE
ncbi:MAG: hypothetical protein IJX98_06700 [Clostridia bacterium]|nr:hypothetical protein [Clostridia bacterium]